MTEPEVLPMFAEPEREDSLKAISLALLKIRSEGVKCKEIARKIGCHHDTIEAASNEHSMLSFDSIAKLGFHYPETRPLILRVWGLGISERPRSPLERLEAAREEIRKALNSLEKAAEATERRTA